jgi:hypothetical protein
VSSKLREQLVLERQLLHRQLDELRALRSACAKQPPSSVERSALAVMLHSFYNGIENLFKRIAVAYDGGIPGGSAAHRDLLDLMARGTPLRPQVISESLRDALDPYLDFRHMLRHAYSFHLDWEKMATLVMDCDSVLVRIDAEIEVFLNSLPREH